MCEQCDEINKKIERFKGIAFRAPDRQTKDAIAGVIVDLEAERAAIHPKAKE